MEVLQSAVQVNKSVNNVDLAQMDDLILDMKENKEAADQVNQMFAAEDEDESELLKELEMMEKGGQNSDSAI
jgi:hypothetical protein